MVANEAETRRIDQLMTEGDIEATALIELTDDLQHAADSESSNVVGGGDCLLIHRALHFCFVESISGIGPTRGASLDQSWLSECSKL
jgi:hypothetical protein